MFAAIDVGARLPLRPLLDAALAERRLGAQRWEGRWIDVGTAERLREANEVCIDP
jgi:NDP-sugar pyrophosphorylase family protein